MVGSTCYSTLVNIQVGSECNVDTLHVCTTAREDYASKKFLTVVRLHNLIVDISDNLSNTGIDDILNGTYLYLPTIRRSIRQVIISFIFAHITHISVLQFQFLSLRIFYLNSCEILVYVAHSKWNSNEVSQDVILINDDCRCFCTQVNKSASASFLRILKNIICKF